MRERLFLLALVLLATPRCLYAQAANDNPTGPAGIFNGNVTTADSGSSYDPYTASATRSVCDISVAGAAQPLALVRTANSRGPVNSIGFAISSWNHNYNWKIDNSSWSTNASFTPNSYSVHFPDGRAETFSAFSVVAGDTYLRAAKGVRERFIPLSGGLAYLVLADGSKVEFRAGQQSYTERNCCTS